MTLFRSSSVHDTLLTSQHARRPARPATAGSSLRPSTQLDYSSAQPDSSSALPISRSASVRAPPAMHQPRDDDDDDYEDHSYSTQSPTYYDVLKCRGDFATPSAFFARPIKPTHSSAATYPWATQPAPISSTTTSLQDGSKHRLRRSANTSSTTDASSSVFAASTDNALPPSVFRLPGARLSARRIRSEDDPWALAGMTAGGRALRKADQLILSPFDRKLTLS
ncbi:hypothetical protein GGI22_002798 [Coemansia erecta]|nr:hypothetical protein GGI22_002798 [Coemansia erecta]